MNTIHVAILIVGYIVLVGTSGKMLNYILNNFLARPVSQTLSKEEIDTGFIIGKCENFLILTTQGGYEQKLVVLPGWYDDQCHIFHNGRACC